MTPRFTGSLVGSSGKMISRNGTRKTGIAGVLQGVTIGVRVNCIAKSILEDIINVYVTVKGEEDKLLATIISSKGSTFSNIKPKVTISYADRETSNAL